MKIKATIGLNGKTYNKDMTLKELRHFLNLTQVQLAPLLGVSVKSIKNYEQGIRKPSKAVLMLLDGLMKENDK